MIKVQVRENHPGDFIGIHTGLLQRIQKHMAVLPDSEPFLHGLIQVIAHPGFKKNFLLIRLDKKRPGRNIDAVLVITGKPPVPQSLGSVAEHGPPVQLHIVADKTCDPDVQFTSYRS
jgi:hypothetical protein